MRGREVAREVADRRFVASSPKTPICCAKSIPFVKWFIRSSSSSDRDVTVLSVADERAELNALTISLLPPITPRPPLVPPLQSFGLAPVEELLNMKRSLSLDDVTACICAAEAGSVRSAPVEDDDDDDDDVDAEAKISGTVPIRPARYRDLNQLWTPRKMIPFTFLCYITR